MHNNKQLLRISILCSCIVLFFMVQCYGQQVLPFNSLPAKFDTLLSDPALASSFTGIKIADVATGKVLYTRNSNKLFHPASTMKLLTTAAAVHMLPAGYTFVTSLFVNTRIVKGVLEGNLYVQGSGDPLLTTAHLDTLAHQLARAGIKKINGNLIGDVSLFDDIQWGAGWMWDDEPEDFEAYISPLTVNANTIKFMVKPGAKAGDHLVVSVEPRIPFYKISNNGTTSSDSTLPPVKVTRPRDINEFIVTGKMAVTDTAIEKIVSVRNPEIYFLHLLKQRLAKKGITVSGANRIGALEQGKLIASVFHPLDSVLHQINKPSDNLAAEILLKTLGKEISGKPGTAQNGLLAVKRYLLECGSDTSQIILADGSGLSFYNELSPDLFIQLLQHEYKQKTFSRFYESLPLAGVEGTIKNRLKSTAAEKNLRAKTGTINGVSTIAGYVTASDSSLLAFCMMTSHFPGKARVLRNLQDTILELLAVSRQ